MPLLVHNIVHYRDYVDFFQRLEFLRDKPVYVQYLPGEGLTRLIPEDSILQFERGIAFDTPLFNQANNLKIVEPLGQGDTLFLELRPDHILSPIYVTPDSVDIDLYYGQESLIYMFHNPSTSVALTIIATLQPDKEALFTRLTREPEALDLRRQAVEKALRLSSQPITDLEVLKKAKLVDSTYIFRPQKGVWMMAFGGEPKHLTKRQGFKAIHVLLQHPRKSIHCLDADRGIVDLARNAPTAPSLPEDEVRQGYAGEMAAWGELTTEMFSGIPRADHKAIQDYRNNLSNLREKRAKAAAREDDSQVESLENKIVEIETQLKKVIGRKGIREDNPEVDKARTRVINNTKNAIDYIAEELPELALHLHTTLTRRTYCRYDPPDELDIPWVL